VLDALDTHNLEDLLEHYWSFSDITPVDLRAKFIRSVRLGEERANRAVEILGRENGKTNSPGKMILEIGSGTGNFLASATGAWEKVVGIDIAMRWLHVSRRRFMDKGLPVPALVCCCAEFLPFADGSFDAIAMTSTLEFTKDQSKVLSECRRALSDSGTLYINSVNRFSLATDPYAYLWGIGFLPRSLQAKYAMWKRGAHYKTKTLSYAEFRGMARAKFGSIRFDLPDVSENVAAQLSPLTRLQIRAYKFLRRLPLFPFLFKQIGPGWDVVLHKS
jgi:ubiquinone/menaquinone biosynthesis C-methylase UbiE